MARQSGNATTRARKDRSQGTQVGSTTAANQQKEITLRKLLEDGLKEMYNAEKQLVKAIPEMAKACESEELQDAFNDHLEQTRKQVERLEKVFTRLKMEPGEKTCRAMEGLIEEGRQLIAEYEENAVRDAALIIGAQKIEHYEIAAYGSLCELADVLGYQKIADVLDRSLEEEENTDKMLTEIARDINDEAFELGGNEQEY